MSCRMIRWLAGRRLDAARPFGRRVQGHLARCAACREWADARAALARDLRADSAAQIVAPAGLVARVQAAVERAQGTVPFFGPFRKRGLSFLVRATRGTVPISANGKGLSPFSVVSKKGSVPLVGCHEGDSPHFRKRQRKWGQSPNGSGNGDSPRVRPLLIRLYPQLLATAAAAVLLAVLTVLALRAPEPGPPPPPPISEAGGLDGLTDLQAALTPHVAADRGSRAIGDLAAGLISDELDRLAEDAKASSRALLAVLPTLDQGQPSPDP